jgi:hypothetical protein
VTLAGCHGPRLPGLLLPFSDLCCFRVIPNLLTGPENPFPFVSPWMSTRCFFSKISETFISFRIFSLTKFNFSSRLPERPISLRSGVFLIPVFLTCE